jgi:predicted transglutaminase-like cysteine proteinase
MKFIFLKIAAGVIAISSIAAAPAQAFSLGGLSRGHTPSIESYTSPTRAPLQYQMFCLQNSKHCRSSGRKVVAYSNGLVRKLQRVNSKVNRSIRPQRDKGDIWVVGAKRGDCEDYVLTKRRDLIRAGVPAGALRVAVVRTRGGVGHAVLVVKTNKGDLVLDNRRKRIVHSHKSGYSFIKMSTNRPLSWVRINNAKYRSAIKSRSRGI